jgi:hypothetical protein
MMNIDLAIGASLSIDPMQENEIAQLAKAFEQKLIQGPKNPGGCPKSC